MIWNVRLLPESRSTEPRRPPLPAGLFIACAPRKRTATTRAAVSWKVGAGAQILIGRCRSQPVSRLNAPSATGSNCWGSLIPLRTGAPWSRARAEHGAVEGGPRLGAADRGVPAVVEAGRGRRRPVGRRQALEELARILQSQVDRLGNAYGRSLL